MSFKTTLRLFIAVCVLSGAIWFVERRSEAQKKKKELSYSLFAVEADDITEFSLDHGELSMTCAMEDGRWMIKAPLAAAADEGEVERILNLFASIPKEEIIVPAQRRGRGLLLKDYGLLNHRARARVATRLGLTDVLIGYDAPLGDLIYVMYAGGHDVMAVHRSLLEIFPKKVETLRDRSLVHGDAGMTSRLEISRPGLFVQLARSEGNWVIRQPISVRADEGKIARLLDSLYKLQVKSFVWDPVVRPAMELDAPTEKAPDNAAAIESYRLTEDEASARITVWVNGDEVGKELILGAELEKDKKQVYAKLRDSESIYTVGSEILNEMAVTVNDLRDRTLITYNADDLANICFEQGDVKLVMNREEDMSWMIVDPVQWRADHKVVKQTLQKMLSLKVLSYMEAAETNLVDYGLSPQRFSISLSGERDDNAEEAKGETQKLLVGSPGNNGRTVYVMFEGTKEVMTVKADDISAIALNPVDPLVYRDRTMLSISRDRVRRISVSRSGIEQTIVRDDDGAWVSDMPVSTNTPAAKVTYEPVSGFIESILLNIGNLRAVSIEAHNASDLSKYGLDKPSEVLTIGLAGEKGIQKSVMIGGSSRVFGIPGRYAMVQGQDVVFVLSSDVVKQLLQGLVRASVIPEVNEVAQ